MAIQTIDRGTSGNASDTFKLGEAFDTCQANDEYLDSIKPTVVNTFADLATTPETTLGMVVYVKQHTSGGVGGGFFQGKAGSVTSDGGTKTNGATAGRHWERINYSELTIEMFGGAASFSAATNLAALKLLIAATSTGGVAVIPPSGTFTIDATGGLSAAADINKLMTLRVDGILKSNFGTMQSNPPYILKVTGDDASITGEGALEGNGSIDDTNSGDETTFPGLVYVTGDNFKCSINKIDTVPKVGILLYNCNNAIINVSRWVGGVVTYTVGHTAYFGLRSTGGAGHRVFGNNFEADASGGKLITGYFSGGLAGKTTNIKFYNNTADVHEKICYLFTDNSKVYNNQVSDALITDAIRIEGSYNKVYRNSGDNVKGAISVYDGKYNEITNNNFTNIQQIGIYVAVLGGSGYVGGFDGTIVKDNELYADTGSSDLTSGIDVVVDGLTSKDIDVSKNTVVGFGDAFDEGNIRVRAITPYSIESSKVDENFVTGGLRAGVIIERVVNSSMSRNKGRSITEYMLVEINGAYNDILDNTVKTVGSIGINSLSSTSNCDGNRYTDAALVGTATLGSAVTTTVTHGGVAPNARVFLQTGEDSAGVLIVARGWPTTARSTNDFTITMANGVAAAGGEDFFYRIVQ